MPKDGFSAGVTQATALVSAATRRPVDRRWAMTGEITLRGLVLPVGGIKEKVLAAHRAGVRGVILPHRNERDLRDMPDETWNVLEWRLVSRIDEVLGIALAEQRAREPIPLASGAEAGVSDLAGKPTQVTRGVLMDAPGWRQLRHRSCR